MKRDAVFQRFSTLTLFKQGSQRAPNKPLLILFALSELERCNRWLEYNYIDEHVTHLLEEFGRPVENHRVHYPFWRLQNDGVWTVLEAGKIRLTESGDPYVGDLKKHEVTAGFSEDVFSVLREDASLRHQIAHAILVEHFPYTMHQDILDAVGLDLTYRTAKRPPRHPEFRKEVLRAYRSRCAVCGFDLKFDNRPVGLQAAHIKWRQAKGPDNVSNGICLCAVHHKMLDKGAIHLTKGLRLVLSESLRGGEPHLSNLQEREGKRLVAPQREKYYPEEDFVRWHMREVFRGA
jgi:putative restriction endonuclease